MRNNGTVGTTLNSTIGTDLGIRLAAAFTGTSADNGPAPAPRRPVRDLPRAGRTGTSARATRHNAPRRTY